MKQVIDVPNKVNYLTEWKGFELPCGVLNKGITACGATTLALVDGYKTIICCPRINLIKNKCQQHKGALAVYGDVTNAEIEDYLRNAEKPKILATYDSMPRLARLIAAKDDWRVVVDEYQYLLIDSSFKSETELRLMEAIGSFPYVTYLSATPIADKYMLQMDWFKGVPYYVLRWNGFDRIKVNRLVSKSPVNNAIEIVRNYQKGIFPSVEAGGKVVESKECVIFLNSVNNILNIIKHTNLQPNEVNIIVASSSENETLIKKLGKGFELGRIPLKGEAHKMITFCTSTAFAGCDFYSTCASTFVISDNKRVNTSIDIATELRQIAGRQRLAVNPFRKEITFIYNVDIGEEEEGEYKAFLEKRLHTSERNAEYRNGMNDKDLRAELIKETVTLQKINKYSESYVWYDAVKDRFSINKMAYLNDLFAYDVQKENYQNSLIVKRQLEENGFAVDGQELQSDYKEQLDCIIKKESFAERMKRYCEYRKNKDLAKFHFANRVMERQNEDLAVYYDALGYDRIKALGYKESNLKNELLKKRKTHRLLEDFSILFPVGTRMLVSTIKEKMNAVYSKYGIQQKGVASHLESTYGFKMKAIKITLDDGSRKNGYEFI